MLANLFKVIFRDLSQNKTYTVISVLGLSAAISISILILTINFSFLTTDRFHENGNRIYQAVCKTNYLKAGTQYSTTTPCLLGESLTQKYPEIKQSATVKSDATVAFVVGDKKFEQNGFYSEGSLFNIFTFPVLQKSSQNIFADDNSIAISKSLAEKYFGNVSNAIGKKIIIRQSYRRKEVFVSSVFKDIPKNSTINFEYVLPLSSLLKEQKWLNTWGNYVASTYFELNANVNVNALNKKIRTFLTEQTPNIKTDLSLYKFHDLFLHPPGGFNRVNVVLINSILALIILSIASINFISLATSRATKKAKEISLRKIIGAKRKSLIFRFLTESFLLSFFAVVLGLFIAELLLPYINRSFNGILFFSIPYGDISFIVSLISLWFLVALLSGLYPAIYLSSMSPISILSGTTESRKRIFIRKSLITAQFVFSTIFIFILIVVIRQTSFITEQNLGFNFKHIIEINLTDALVNHFDSFSSELKNNPAIEEVTRTSFEPFSIYSTTSGLTWDGKPESLNDMFSYMAVDENFIKTFDMQIKAGRDFLKGDSDDTRNLIVNERMAEIIKKFSKSDVVGLGINFWGGQGQIIGVVKDFQNGSLQENIHPLIIRKNLNECNYCFVKVYTKNIPAVLSYINNTYSEFEREYPFKYSFLDDQFLNKHVDILILDNFLSIFSIIAIIISCLGLFGLTAFTIQQKTKEIGVRKVLGASISSLSFLLTKSVIKLVILGTLIALPVAYYMSVMLLQMYIHRVQIKADIYLISVASVMIIASATVISLTVKKAATNPVEALRYE